MKRFVATLAVLLACAPSGSAQQTFLIWCTAGAGSARMGSGSVNAFGVVGQGVAGVTGSGSFTMVAGFVADTLVVNTLVGTEAGEGEETLPTSYALEQNYPNPFNPATTIRYALKSAQHVELKIYNLVGEEVATLVDGDVPAGVHTVLWNAGGYASGVYFCRLRTQEFTATRKLMLLR